MLDPDAARLLAMFEGLTYYDENYKLQMGLAEEFSSILQRQTHIDEP